MMGIGLLFWIAVIAGAVALVLWAVRTSRAAGPARPGHEPDAMEIARRRYAKGELTKEQFEQLKQDLTK